MISGCSLWTLILRAVSVGDDVEIIMCHKKAVNPTSGAESYTHDTKFTASDSLMCEALPPTIGSHFASLSDDFWATCQGGEVRSRNVVTMVSMAPSGPGPGPNHVISTPRWRDRSCERPKRKGNLFRWEPWISSHETSHIHQTCTPLSRLFLVDLKSPGLKCLGSADACLTTTRKMGKSQSSVQKCLSRKE